jgi:hypothetical protein
MQAGGSPDGVDVGGRIGMNRQCIDPRVPDVIAWEYRAPFDLWTTA